MEPVNNVDSSTNFGSTSKRSRCRSNTRIGTTIAIMTVSFYVCWIPFAIRCILSMLQYDVETTFAGLTLLFAKFGVIVNPLLYIFHNQEVSWYQTNMNLEGQRWHYISLALKKLNLYIFQITGPTITSAVIQRRATLRKRKQLKRSLIELRKVERPKDDHCNSV